MLFVGSSSIRLWDSLEQDFQALPIVTKRGFGGSRLSDCSDHVSKLLGTIYIPGAELKVSTAGNVAQDSAWSIIVADTITVEKNPVLVINSGYGGSGVPVPDGVGPKRNNATLSK